MIRLGKLLVRNFGLNIIFLTCLFLIGLDLSKMPALQKMIEFQSSVKIRVLNAIFKVDETVLLV